MKEKAVSLHFPDTTALFFIAVFPCINDEAVTGRERNASFRSDLVRRRSILCESFSSLV